MASALEQAAMKMLGLDPDALQKTVADMQGLASGAITLLREVHDGQTRIEAQNRRIMRSLGLNPEGDVEPFKPEAIENGGSNGSGGGGDAA